MLWHFSLVTLPHAIASLLIFAMSTTISVVLGSFGLLDHVHEYVWKPWHKLFYNHMPSIFNPAAVALLILAGIIAVVGGYATWWYQSYHRQTFRTTRDRRIARKAKDAVETVRSTAMNIVDAVSPRRIMAYEQQLENKLGLHGKSGKSGRQNNQEDEESGTSGTEYENESEIVARRGIGSSSQHRSSSKSKSQKSRAGNKASSKQRSKQEGDRDRSSSPSKKTGRPKGRTARANTTTSKNTSGKSRSPSKSPVRRLQSL